MNSLAVVNAGSIQAQAVTGSLFTGFINFLDAKPKTIESYSKNLKAFFRWLSDNGITNPQFADVKAYRDELLSKYKASTVQAYIFTVRRFFEWTESAGLYPNIAGKLKGATLSRDFKKDYLTSAQVRDVVGGIEGDTLGKLRDKAIVMLMVACGLREQGKGRDERAEFVIVPQAVERAIRAYLKARGEAEGAEALFASLSNNSKGQRMTTRSISGIVKAAMRAAGFDSERLTAHSLRHTAVTLALLGGATVQEAQQFARHKSIATTMIYSHNLEAMSNPCSGLVANSVF